MFYLPSPKPATGGLSRPTDIVGYSHLLGGVCLITFLNVKTFTNFFISLTVTQLRARTTSHVRDEIV